MSFHLRKTIENRTLQLTMLYFNSGNQEQILTINNFPRFIHDMEEEMMVNILKARFLVPVETEVDGRNSDADAYDSLVKTAAV